MLKCILLLPLVSNKGLLVWYSRSKPNTPRSKLYGLQSTQQPLKSHMYLDLDLLHPIPIEKTHKEREFRENKLDLQGNWAREPLDM